VAVVWTIEERCKRCYTCIRECPAKAIKVERGQAKVIEHRCLGCGHCVRVCSQHAKAVLDGVSHTIEILKSSQKVIAMLAPSFPAAFPNSKPEYKRLAESDEKDLKRPVIASSCPAICQYIEKYAPELADNLAPIVSPMIAMGKVVRHFYGEDVKTVFIGPCTAKKVEQREPEVTGIVEEALTFKEMEDLFSKLGINPEDAEEDWFDPPHAYLGRIYPISGGLIRSSGLNFDLMENDIILTEGKHRIMLLIDSIRKGEVRANMVDVLFCEGCINGPFMNDKVNYFYRKQKIVEFTESRRDKTSYSEWQENIRSCQEIDIHRTFRAEPVETGKPSEEEIRKILAEINKFDVSDELNCGACGYSSCREYAVAVYEGLAEKEMCMPYLIEKYDRTQKQLRRSLEDLAAAQEQLIQSEKLASIGQLASKWVRKVTMPKI